jgi:pilus assembly protein Flp/PilA
MTHHNDVSAHAPAQHDSVQGLGARMRTAGRRLGAALRSPFVRAHRGGNDSGASAVEYGLLVAAIAAVIVVVVFALGGLVKDKFQETCTGIAGTNQQQIDKCNNK